MLGMVKTAMRVGLGATGRASYTKAMGIGAAAGGIYGAFSNDTSIMGGAMMGAGMGAGARFGATPLRRTGIFAPSYKQAVMNKAARTARPPVGGAAGRTAGGGGAPTAAPFQKKISTNNAVNSTPPYARGRAGMRSRRNRMRYGGRVATTPIRSL